jgi:beta-lactamase class A
LHFANANSDMFSNDLSRFIADNSQNTKHISAYIYLFKSKKVISYNESYKYLPASLSKIAIMITYYKLAEADPKILQNTLVYKKRNRNSLSQNIHPKDMLEVGKAYKIDDLINRMIISSDNDATNVLINNLTDDALQKTFTDVGIAAPQPDDFEYSISIADFSKFFIELENATYLNKTMSQKALEVLKLSHYKDGLVAGVPDTIPVAEKFGERVIKGTKSVNQFHECGIVFYPGNPYLLCVMTDGNDIYQQAKIVKNISHFVYGTTTR